MSKPLLLPFSQPFFELNTNEDISNAKNIPVFKAGNFLQNIQTFETPKIPLLNNKFKNFKKVKDESNPIRKLFNDNTMTRNKEFQADDQNLKTLESEDKFKCSPIISTLKGKPKLNRIPFRKIKKFNNLKQFLHSIEKNKNLNSIQMPFDARYKFKIEPTIKKGIKYCRNRSFGEFLELQMKFSAQRETKIAHKVQIKFNEDEKINRKFNSFNPSLKSSPVKNTYHQHRAESRTSDESEQQIPNKNKVSISKFQKYVKDHLSIKQKPAKEIKQTYEIKERKSHNKYLLLKMMKNLDNILVQNKIYSNQITFTEMELILENLGFAIKNKSKEQSKALNFVWNSINLKGENTITLKDFKLVLFALYNIKPPEDTCKNSAQSGSKHSCYCNSPNDSFDLKTDIKSNINLLKINHIMRTNRNSPNIESKKSKSKYYFSKEKIDEMLSRISNKICDPPSLEEVLITRNDPKLNLLNKNENDKISIIKISESNYN